MSIVSISRAAFEAMVAHAREALPNECCGLMIGETSRDAGAEDSARIDVVVRARNVDDSPTRFTIDPLDHFNAIRQARMRGQQVIGVYHSHPAGPETPSERDRAEASYIEYLYVIITPTAPVVRAFRLLEGNFVELRVTTFSDEKSAHG